MAFFERLTGWTLRDPAWLLAALLVPAAILWARRAAPPAIRFAPGFLLDPARRAAAAGVALPRSWRVRLLALPRALAVLGLVLVVLALARPVERVAAPLVTEGVDILLCLDTSSSMTANDMDAERTRLDVARDAAAAFVRARTQDRIGLLTFARYADLRCPLTRDHDALLGILAGVGTVASDGPEDATGVGTALARAAQVLASGAAASRVVVLLTDGEENVAVPGAQGEIPPAHAAQLCEQLGVRVQAIVAGVGRRDATGAPVALDTAPIERVAARTGGAFLRARDAAAVAAVYARIDELERSPIQEPRYELADRHLLFLLAGILLLLAGRGVAAFGLEVLP